MKQGKRISARKCFCVILAAALVLGLTACRGTARQTSPEAVKETTGEAAKDGQNINETAEVLQSGNDPQEQGEQTASDVELEKYRTGTPWICSDLKGAVTENTPVSLKDDFHLFVNKEAMLKTEIPEGYPVGGTLADVTLKQQEDIKRLFTENHKAENHDAQLALDMYGLLMDWDNRNSLGAEPLKKLTDKADRISTLEELSEYLTKSTNEELLASPESVSVMASFDDASRNALYVSPMSLILGDSAEYKVLTDYGKIKKEAVTELIRRMLGKLGYSEEETETKIGNAFRFDELMASSIMTSEQQQSPDYVEKINNHYTIDELDSLSGNYPLKDILNGVYGFREFKDIVVAEPEFIRRLGEIYTEDNVECITDWIIVRGSVSMTSVLDRECFEWKNDYNNTVEGSEGTQDDETVFASMTEALLPWPVARLYSDVYLKAEDKERLTKLVEDVIDVYHRIINEADFITEDTKKNAIEKLEARKLHVYYPDDWSKYECDGLEIRSAGEGGNVFEAYAALSKYNAEKMVRDYYEPVDNDLWSGTPSTVNCFYNFTNNSINILAGFANGSIYNSEMSDEEVYAGIGTVIGHEISHGFDSTGSQFDKNGNMKDWWTEEDKQKFNQKNKKMADYFNKMHPWEGQDFYGGIMTGEAGADMGGVKSMLMLAEKKEDFDYDLFFRRYAANWMEQCSLQMCYRYFNDVHPIGYLRTNVTLQQFDEFINTYDIREGDGMYLAPEDRVNVG